MSCVLKDLIALSKDGEWGKGDPFQDSVEMLAIRGTDFGDVRFGDLSSVPRRHIPGGIARRKTLQPWDVIIEAAGGTKDQITGRTLLLRPSAFTDTTVPLTCASFSRFIRFNNELCDPEYMFWYLQNLYSSGMMHAYHTQHTGVARFQWTTFSEREPLHIPSIPKQQRVSPILAAHDILIQINQRRIRLLEEMALNLYREWFVQFRFPGHDRSACEASPIGLIPRGWTIKPLSSLMLSQIGGGWGKEVADEKHSDPAWVIRGTDIPAARHAGLKKVPHRYHSTSNLRARRLQTGDIVFEVSGGSKGQPVGRALLMTPTLLSAFNGSDVICASFCKRVQPDANAYGSELLYLSFLEGYYSGEIEQYQVQSTGISNFKWTEYIAKTMRAIPPEPLRTQFRSTVVPIFNQITLLGLSNAVLHRTRDLLLPRLMAGQINLEAD